MERALNLGLLRAALGEGGMFPSPEELQRRLAEAEIALFLQRGTVDEELLGTAGICTASVPPGRRSKYIQSSGNCRPTRSPPTSSTWPSRRGSRPRWCSGK
jgi:hypothetical protein